MNLPEIIIGVASGKGGVGKSTVSTLLAQAFSKIGKKAALFDADIYGPSIPLMFGVDSKPSLNSKGNIEPLEAYGVKVMSIGFMIEQNSPLIWRGPMVQGAIKQMLQDVDWGECDIMVIDLPPGTGDAQLTLCQTLKLTGAILVSTPQDISYIDAGRALDMFVRLGVPILGIIENMSSIVCPCCKTNTKLFTKGKIPNDIKAKSLGELHFDPRIAKCLDQGKSVFQDIPDSQIAEYFLALASSLVAKK